MLKNALKHFITITKHKILVFKLCCKAGQHWRGFMHDWSKYSWTEFWESAKYYQGNCSPIIVCKRQNGYSNAWLHHKGRNKHHPEYWYDYATPEKTIPMPYEYAVEMICDNLAAGKVYNGKQWNNRSQLEYWNRVGSKREQMHEKTATFATIVYEQIAEEGIDKVINKNNLKKIYKECMNKSKIVTQL